MRNKDIVRYLGYFFYLVFFYFFIVYTRPLYIEFILKYFSRIRYNDDLSYEALGAKHVVLLAYVVVSLFWNRRTLRAIGNSTILMWVINGLIDYLCIPLGVLIMVVCLNTTKTELANLSLIENMFLMWGLMAIKHILLRVSYKKTKQA